MLRIRLRRTGAKKQPSYRVVVADARTPRDGRAVEIIGHYNPRTEPTTIVVKRDRAEYWLGKGAQPSERVAKLFYKLGIPGVPPPRYLSAAARQAAVAAAPAGGAEVASATPEQAVAEQAGEGE